jgi:plastocyanin
MEAGLMKKVLIGIVVALVVVIIGVAVEQATNPKRAADSTEPTAVAQVSITENGFVPATITVKKGTVVTWTNNHEEVAHQVASNPHPTHTDLDGLESEGLDEHDKYSFQFNKVGTFSYHDHISPLLGGTVIVEE